MATEAPSTHGNGKSWETQGNQHCQGDAGQRQETQQDCDTSEKEQPYNEAEHILTNKCMDALCKGKVESPSGPRKTS